MSVFPTGVSVVLRIRFRVVLRVLLPCIRPCIVFFVLASLRLAVSPGFIRMCGVGMSTSTQ